MKKEEEKEEEEERRPKKEEYKEKTRLPVQSVYVSEIAPIPPRLFAARKAPD